MKLTLTTLVLLVGTFMVTQTSVMANECFFGRTDSILGLKYVDGFAGNVDGVQLYGPPISPVELGISAPTPKSSSLADSSFTISKGPGTVGIEVDRRSSFLSFTDGRIPGGEGLLSMPEPATIVLLGSGLTGVAAACWKRRRAVR